MTANIYICKDIRCQGTGDVELTFIVTELDENGDPIETPT